MFTEIDGRVLIAKYSPDGTRIAVAGGPENSYQDRGFVGLYDAQSLACLWLHHQPFEVSCLAWEPLGTCLAYGGKEGCVCVWNTLTDTFASAYLEHSPELECLPVACYPRRREIYAVAWSSPTTLTSTGEDKFLRIWDCLDNTGAGTYEPQCSSLVAHAPDGQLAAISLLATANSSFPFPAIVLYNLETGQPWLSLCHQKDVCSLAWSPSPEKRRLAIGTSESIDVWEVDVGKLLVSLPYSPYETSVTYQPSPRSLAWSPDGEYIACCCKRSWEHHHLSRLSESRWQAVIEMKNAMTGVTQGALPSADAYCVDWSPRGDQMVVGCMRGFEVHDVSLFQRSEAS